MKAVVFGGSGFLGSYVADALTQEGMEVTIFDKDHSTYLMPKQKMVAGDIMDLSAIKKTVQGADIVYNFAGIADIEESAKDPLKTIHFNVIGNSHILEACRLAGVKRFVFASSLYVYSNSGSFYRVSKQCSELIIEAYAEKYGLNYTILRYGSLYGPRANKYNWVNQILHQAMTEKKITRHGDGRELREYIHVSDAAKLSVKVLDEQYKNKCVIITGHQSIKIADVMIMIREMLNNDIELEFLEGNQESHYEITPYNFKPKLAQRILGDNYVDFGQGILDIIHTLYHESEKNKEEAL